MRRKEESKHYKTNKMGGITTYLSIITLKLMVSILQFSNSPRHKSCQQEMNFTGEIRT
jgi:hypothetical protein